MEALPNFLNEPTMAITLEQVAKLAGVSRSTASRVINDQPNVRAEVRERVWEVIHEQGYQPNLAARTLANKRADEQTPEKRLTKRM